LFLGRTYIWGEAGTAHFEEVYRELLPARKAQRALLVLSKAERGMVFLATANLVNKLDLLTIAPIESSSIIEANLALP